MVERPEVELATMAHLKRFQETKQVTPHTTDWKFQWEKVAPRLKVPHLEFSSTVRLNVIITSVRTSDI